MKDFSKRRVDPAVSRLQGDTERAVSSLRGDIDADAYTPANAADWADPQPTTRAEALDRLAKAVAAGTSGPVGV